MDSKPLGKNVLWWYQRWCFARRIHEPLHPPSLGLSISLHPTMRWNYGLEARLFCAMPCNSVRGCRRPVARSLVFGSAKGQLPDRSYVRGPQSWKFGVLFCPSRWDKGLAFIVPHCPHDNLCNGMWIIVSSLPHVHAGIRIPRFPSRLLPGSERVGLGLVSPRLQADGILGFDICKPEQQPKPSKTGTSHNLLVARGMPQRRPTLGQGQIED
jgi:hypothetical protein